MTRFLATVENIQAKIVPGLGTLCYFPGATMIVILYIYDFLPSPVSGLFLPAPNQRPRKSWPGRKEEQAGAHAVPN